VGHAEASNGASGWRFCSASKGARDAVVDAATEKDADLLDAFVPITFQFPVDQFGRRSERRRTDELVFALGLDPAVGARLEAG
jgi:hypothetical protein